MMSFFTKLREKRNIMRRLSSLGPLIANRNWDGMTEVMNSFSEFDQAIKDQYFLEECNQRLKMILFYILYVALTYNPPIRVIQGILNIEPSFAPDLVEMSDLMIRDFPVETACNSWCTGDVIELLLKLDRSKLSFRSQYGDKRRNLLHYATVCALSQMRRANGEPILFPEEHPHDDGDAIVFKCSNHKNSSIVNRNVPPGTTTHHDAQEYEGLMRENARSTALLIPEEEQSSCFSNYDDFSTNCPYYYEDPTPQNVQENRAKEVHLKNNTNHSKYGTFTTSSSAMHHNPEIHVATFLNLMLYLCKKDPILVIRRDDDGLTPLDIVSKVRSTLRTRSTSKGHPRKKSTKTEKNSLLAAQLPPSSPSKNTTISSSSSSSTIIPVLRKGKGKRKVEGITENNKNFDKNNSHSYSRRVDIIYSVLKRTDEKVRQVLKERKENQDEVKTDCAQICDEDDFHSERKQEEISDFFPTFNRPMSKIL